MSAVKGLGITMFIVIIALTIFVSVFVETPTPLSVLEEINAIEITSIYVTPEVRKEPRDLSHFFSRLPREFNMQELPDFRQLPILPDSAVIPEYLPL